MLIYLSILAVTLLHNYSNCTTCHMQYFYLHHTFYGNSPVLFQDDYERRFLVLCEEGTADISQFSYLLCRGVDPNVRDKVVNL